MLLYILLGSSRTAASADFASSASCQSDDDCETTSWSMIQQGGLLQYSQKQSRKPMLWIHLHKNAGTSICELARANSEIIVKERFDGGHSINTNCMWMDHDHYKLLNASIGVSCTDRNEAFAKNHWTFGMIEREVNDNDMCEGFLYGIALRDPMSRVISSARYDNVNVSRVIECIRSGGSSCDPQQWHFHRWIFFDNYQTRILLGKEGLKIPPRGVTEHHAQQVISMLSRFDIVTFVEELADKTPNMFKNTLGWWDTTLLHEREHANEKEEQVFTNEEFSYIEELNRVDRIVYDHFRLLPVDSRS